LREILAKLLPKIEKSPLPIDVRLSKKSFVASEYNITNLFHMIPGQSPLACSRLRDGGASEKSFKNKKTRGGWRLSPAPEALEAGR